jgi:hypothetical protein
MNRCPKCRKQDDIDPASAGRYEMMGWVVRNAPGEKVAEWAQNWLRGAYDNNEMAELVRDMLETSR